MRHLVHSLVLAAVLVSPARADIARLSATYDGVLSNTVFTITNVGTVSEAVALQTSFATPTTVTLANLAAGATETYTFNQLRGGFGVDPASLGTPDTTTYTLVVGLNNAAPMLRSNTFSPLANLTGGDVDFLGNQCVGFAGGACGTTLALSGLVAAVPTPAAAVPEPMSAATVLAGLVGLRLRRRRT